MRDQTGSSSSKGTEEWVTPLNEQDKEPPRYPPSGLCRSLPTGNLSSISSFWLTINFFF